MKEKEKEEEKERKKTWKDGGGGGGGEIWNKIKSMENRAGDFQHGRGQLGHHPIVFQALYCMGT